MSSGVISGVAVGVRVGVSSGLSTDSRTDEGADETTIGKCGVKQEIRPKPGTKQFRDL